MKVCSVEVEHCRWCFYRTLKAKPPNFECHRPTALGLVGVYLTVFLVILEVKIVSYLKKKRFGLVVTREETILLATEVSK